MTRLIKFRQLFECEKGHTRWAYFFFPEDINQELKLVWGPQYCDCSVGMKGIWSPIKEKQQFIGVRDKNDVEIYEGDIVEEKAKGKEYRLQAVKWNQSNVGFYFYNSGTKFIQVVGNIYQNPEMQKELTS